MEKGKEMEMETNPILGRATLEESFGRRKFYIAIEDEFKKYEKRMLCDSGCPCTLPMYFLFEEGRERAYYDFTGLRKLEEHIRGNSAAPGMTDQKIVREGLELLSGILVCLKNMEYYLLHPRRASLHTDLIFYQPSGGVKLAFYPEEAPQPAALQARIMGMIENMEAWYGNSEAPQYLRKFRGLIEEKNLGLEGMISCLGTLQREVSYIYWNPVDSRELEKNPPPPEEEKGDADSRRRPFSLGRRSK